MAIRIGINGFGRIGRLVVRAGLKDKNVEFVGVNDLVPPDNLAYLFRYDTVHGRYAGTVAATESALKIDGHTWNAVDPERARDFMARVRAAR